jgi:hypothetical protein
VKIGDTVKGRNPYVGVKMVVRPDLEWECDESVECKLGVYVRIVWYDSISAMHDQR